MGRGRSKKELPSLFDVDMSESSDISPTDPTPSGKPSTANITWSFSKSGLLEQCPRKFYYNYYGGNARAAKSDPEKAVLRPLKAAVNRHTRTGEILHVAIADYMRKAQQGQGYERKGWLDWARRVFGRDIELSKAGLGAEVSSWHANPPKFLIEFLHEENAVALCRAAEANMVAALETFLDSPEISPVREAGMRQGSLIERHFRRIPDFSFGVEGQVDLAYRSDDDTVTLVDWKIGDELGEGDDSLQLAVYALWAKETFGCETEAIRAYKAFLGSGNLVAFSLDDSLLRSAQLKIEQDARCFVRMHGYGQDAMVMAFTPCGQEEVCVGCSFATACPAGKEIIDGRV